MNHPLVLAFVLVSVHVLEAVAHTETDLVSLPAFGLGRGRLAAVVVVLIVAAAPAVVLVVIVVAVQVQYVAEKLDLESVEIAVVN